MNIKVDTSALKRAIDLCGVVALMKSSGDDQAAMLRSCLRFTVRSKVLEIAAFERNNFLTLIPLEAEVSDYQGDPVRFAVEMFRLKGGLDNAGGSDTTTIRYTEADAEEGFIYVQFKRKFLPYGTYKADSLGEYQSIIDKAEEMAEWEVDEVAQAFGFVKQFVVADDKDKEAHRVMQVREDSEERWCVQGFDGNAVAFCYPPNAGDELRERSPGDLKMKREHVNKLLAFLSRSKSDGMVVVKETSDWFVYQLDDDGATFAHKKTALAGKAFSRSDPLSTDDESIHIKVSRPALQAALGVVSSGMPQETRRVCLSVEDGDDEMTISAQSANNHKKIYTYTVPVQHGDYERGDDEEANEPLELDPFEHYTGCGTMMDILPSMADEIDIWIKPGRHMKLIDKKGDMQRSVVVFGMKNQRW